MNLKKGHFSLGTAIINFLDKPYQEINFKSHLNSLLLCKQGKILSDLDVLPCLVWFYCTLLVCAHFCNKIEKCQL